MIVFRSFIFAIAFYGWSTILTPIYVLLMLIPRRPFWFMCCTWVRSCLFLARYIAGIRWEVRGWENVPDGAVIVASKHQSTFDTMVFNTHFYDCVYVIKRELFWFPGFGWFMWRIGQIGVDRKAGGSIMRSFVSQAQEKLAEGRSIIIFPQGTRTLVGAERPYLPGIAALYQRSDAPVVPVALNSGLHWARRRFHKQPGTIIIEYLPPIPQGLDRREFMRTLEERIETATKRLEAEGLARIRGETDPT